MPRDVFATERSRRLAETADQYATSVNLVKFCRLHSIPYGRFNRRARYWRRTFFFAYVAAQGRGWVPVAEAEAALETQIAARVAHGGSP